MPSANLFTIINNSSDSFMNEGSQTFPSTLTNGHANASSGIVEPAQPAIFVPDIGPFDRVLQEMPLSGYPGLLFYIIHISAVVCLTISTCVGVILIVYLFVFGTHGKVPTGEQKQPDATHPSSKTSESGPPDIRSKTRLSFWRWNIAERMVIYLAVADLGFSGFHLIDKWYYLLAVANPPDGLCSMVGFTYNQFMFSQWIVVVVAAINACSLVVFNKKLDLGRWDWKLILIAYGTPFVGGAIELRLGLLGQSGAWCFVDYRTTAGKRFAQVIGIIEIMTFGILAVSYGAIWMKIRQSSKVVDASIQRCNRTAKMMMIFVVSFFFQWWIQCVIVIWTYILGTMPSFIPVISGCVVNMGGVYDCVAYTIIRRKFQKRVSPA